LSASFNAASCAWWNTEGVCVGVGVGGVGGVGSFINIFSSSRLLVPAKNGKPRGCPAGDG